MWLYRNDGDKLYSYKPLDSLAFVLTRSGSGESTPGEPVLVQSYAIDTYLTIGKSLLYVLGDPLTVHKKF